MKILGNPEHTEYFASLDAIAFRIGPLAYPYLFNITVYDFVSNIVLERVITSMLESYHDTKFLNRVICGDIIKTGCK